MTYKVSKDYKRLKQLLDKGDKVVCFVNFDLNMEGNIFTDICLAECVGSGENMKYKVSCRGITYISVEPLWFSDFTEKKLHDAFEQENLQFIDPDYERNTLELDGIRIKAKNTYRPLG